jgi:hypothetical protein
MRVADIPEFELGAMVKEWVSRVTGVPELVAIPLSDGDRMRHLAGLCCDLITRLRLGERSVDAFRINKYVE